MKLRDLTAERGTVFCLLVLRYLRDRQIPKHSEIISVVFSVPGFSLPVLKTNRTFLNLGDLGVDLAERIVPDNESFVYHPLKVHSRFFVRNASSPQENPLRAKIKKEHHVFSA
ncbi:hypothetical protein TNCV_2518311 [Trichonephila clavipes]|nr:hypothetical protein TNCV_2518311 [Trichonephila clavipes]